MDTLLVLAGLGGMSIAIVNLISPRGRLGLINRQRAGVLLGASLVTILIGGAIAQVPGDVNPIDSGAHPGPSEAQMVTVLAITDGDTLTVAFDDGRSETVRLIGINTPEFGECFADEATAALTAMVPPGSQVGMTVDVSDRDQFDRLLRYVWVGQISVNEELVRRGAAFARRYPPDTGMADRFETAMASAQSAGLGLWAPNACDPVSGSRLRTLKLF